MNELIVVGIDGSPEAATALEQAAQDAVRRGATLRVVSVARLPEVWAVPLGMAPPTVPVRPGELASDVREKAQAAVDALFAAHPDLAGQITVEVVAVSGNPATELVEQSREADLLVLGHRGLGGMASAFLGSVGLTCVLHAHCPVSVVRPPRQAEAEPATGSARTVAPSTV
jgi:nucleotide-binding universal stress UspA family protein